MSVTNINKGDRELVEFLETTIEAVKNGTITSFCGVYLTSDNNSGDFYIVEPDKTKIMHSELILSVRDYENTILTEYEYE
jgi:hypothetical protein